MRIGAVSAAAFLACACAGGPAASWTGDRFVHRGRGYQVAAPGAEWRHQPLEGADVAFAGPGRARMSLSSRCNVPLAPPSVLARHLRFSIGPHRVLESEALEEDGGAAWRQRLQTDPSPAGGESVAVETVTRVRGRCVFDWVLVAPAGSIDAATDTFSAWRSSFAPAAGAP